MKVILLVGILTFQLFGCNQNAALTESEKELVIDEVRAMLHNYHQSMNSGGLLTEFDFLDHSDDFFWIPPGYSIALSYDSVAAVLTKTAPTLREMKYTWETLNIYPLSKTLASFNGRVSGIITDTSGTTTKVILLESGNVIKRTKGWQLLNGQSRILPE